MRNNIRLVYWGAGKIGKLCLKQFTNTCPEFFIDSYWENGTFYDISVKRPDEIEKWDELFIVITTTAFEEIEAILINKKLVRNKNYSSYQDYFCIKKVTIEERIKFYQEFIEKNQKYKNSILITAPIFSGRAVELLVHFFRQYAIKIRPQKCVLISHAAVINEINFEKIMGYPAFNDNITFDIKHLIHEILLSEDEKKWICELQERKLCEDKELSYSMIAESYWYYKNIISIFEPSKVIIWSGWTYQSHILAELSKRNRIPYGFMEIGWIPGTLQFDRRGIAGQSEYAVDPDKLLNLKIKNKQSKMKKIREYIISNRIDTGVFRESEEDERNLSRIDKQKKTIFFVGMDDYGMGMNPQADYWKKYVSSNFKSTLDAVLFVAKICEKNGWNFIFKPHPNPAHKNELSEDLIQSIIQIKYMEIDRLIQLCDAVISIASAVDYKVLIYGKALIQLGHTTLRGKGCSYEVFDVNEIEPQLRIALEKGMTKEQNENFELHMAQLLENYLWDDLSERELRYGQTLDTDFFERRGSDI